MTRRRRLLLVTAALVAALPSVYAASASAAQPSAPVGPSGARFYSPHDKLPAGPHGTLIWQRPYSGTAALSGASNTLLLYKQLGIRGKLVATSGYVSVPKGKAPKGGWPLIAWAHGTTGLADQCAPTRGYVASGEERNFQLLDKFIHEGYAVVSTDYEGLGTPGVLPYLNGPSAARSVLDSVLAARQFDPQLSDRVVISGHSEGGDGALWAAALAHSYTPKIDVRGELSFAPVSHLSTDVTASRSVTSPKLSQTIVAFTQGVNVAHPSLHVLSLLSPAAAKLAPQVLTRCFTALMGKDSFGSLPTDQVFDATTNLSPLTTTLQRNDPDTLRINVPVLLEQGLKDTNVLPPFTAELATALRANGSRSVTEHTWPNATHSTVAADAARDAESFLRRRLGR